ncbi:hypothetical protein Q3G72_013028 [Acer saccharum]|nr:hypothetical protein Q3G72_013028 [Acer saccharum]
MDAADIAKLCASLSISDVDGPIQSVSRDLEFELGIGIGPPTDAVPRVFSMNVNQGEGHNLQLSTYSKVAQTDGFPENDEGKDMEIVIVDNLSSLATESQPEVPESHGDSSKVGIRKWKRIARAKGTNLKQDPSGDLNPVQSSLYAVSPVLGDGVLTERRDPSLMISEHPLQSTSDGGVKRKVSFITPVESPTSKKQKEFE